MTEFITTKNFIGQSDKDGVFYTLHNQLYLSDKGELELVPRFFKTDGYTIPKILAFIGGSKLEWDIRPAVRHDFDCRYHCYIRVNMPLNALIEAGMIKNAAKLNTIITLTENIPTEYLEIIPLTFKEANDRFKEAMKSVNCIKNWRVAMMRFAVNFNVGWLKKPKKLNLEQIYEDFI